VFLVSHAFVGCCPGGPVALGESASVRTVGERRGEGKVLRHLFRPMSLRWT
jgi:hypothetical protein